MVKEDVRLRGHQRELLVVRERGISEQICAIAEDRERRDEVGVGSLEGQGRAGSGGTGTGRE